MGVIQDGIYNHEAGGDHPGMARGQRGPGLGSGAL